MKKFLNITLLSAVFVTLTIPAIAGGKNIFEQKDTNGDDVITKEEFLAGPLKRFRKFDLDNDGKITKEEARKVRARLENAKGNSDGDVSKKRERLQNAKENSDGEVSKKRERLQNAKEKAALKKRERLQNAKENAADVREVPAR